MSSLFKEVIRFQDVSDPQWWTRTRAVGTTCTLVALISAGVLAFKAPWWAGAAVLGIGLLLGCVVAPLGRWWYWQSGTGYRLAISFTGGKVAFAELQATRQHFVEAARTSKLDRVTVRLVYPSYLDGEARQDRFLKRWKFDHVLRIGIAPDPKSADKNKFLFEMRSALEGELNTTLFESSLKPLAMIASASAQPSHEVQRAEFQSRHLFDILLFFLGTVAVNDERFIEAGSFLSVLDERLASRGLHERAQPRLAVRDMAAKCWAHSLRRNATDWIVDQDELRRVCAIAVPRILPLLTQFQQPTLIVARALFLIGDKQKALELCNAARIASKDAESLMLARLGEAAIYLLSSRFEEALHAYKEFFASPTLSSINWADLIDFAEAAIRLDNPNGVFALGLYTKSMNGVADNNLNKRVEDWLNGDSKRMVLAPLYFGQSTVRVDFEQKLRPAPTRSPFKERSRARTRR